MFIVNFDSDTETEVYEDLSSPCHVWTFLSVSLYNSLLYSTSISFIVKQTFEIIKSNLSNNNLYLFSSSLKAAAVAVVFEFAYAMRRYDEDNNRLNKFGEMRISILKSSSYIS